MDVGCYCVSAARLLGGEPEAVSGQQLIGGDGVDVAFAGSMRFDGEMLAHFDAGLALADRDELEVVGDEASLFLDDPWHCRRAGDRAAPRRRASSASSSSRPTPTGWRPRTSRRRFAAQAQPRLGRADAVGQARVIEALYADGEPMSEERRAGAWPSNEDMFRDVNEGIVRGQWPGDPEAPIGFRCECARLGCNVLVALTLAEYEARARQPASIRDRRRSRAARGRGRRRAPRRRTRWSRRSAQPAAKPSARTRAAEAWRSCGRSVGQRRRGPGGRRPDKTGARLRGSSVTDRLRTWRRWKRGAG